MLARSNSFLVVCSIAAFALAAGEAPRRSGPVVPNTKPGTILCEFFKGIPGQSVNDLIKNPAFPNNPTESVALSSFEIPPTPKTITARPCAVYLSARVG